MTFFPSLLKANLRSRVVECARSLLERCGSAALSRPGLRGIDRKLAEFLDFHGGFFVEAGANDGFQQSNTYYLARFRGWRGILVEPIPALAEQCRNRRSESRVFAEALVSSDNGDSEIEIRYAGLMSLVKGSLDSDELEQERVRDGFRFQQLVGDQYELLTVPARTLTAILSEAGAPSRFDLLSLDVEGYEVEVLRGLDFDRYLPRYICIEVFRDNAAAVHNLLESRYVIREVLSEHELYRDLLFELTESGRS